MAQRMDGLRTSKSLAARPICLGQIQPGVAFCKAPSLRSHLAEAEQFGIPLVIPSIPAECNIIGAFRITVEITASRLATLIL